jgi:hypothetical protein
MIAEKRNRKIGWAKALGELIDNSVGNGAAAVRILFKPHYVKCIDDGVGCDDRKFPAMVSLGMHVEDDMVKNQVSRYGFGAKDAFIWAGGPTRVFSSLIAWCDSRTRNFTLWRITETKASRSAATPCPSPRADCDADIDQHYDW